MTPTQTIASPQTISASDKPKAIGFVRNDVSGLAAPRHASDVQRHAHMLGYQHVYTVRPPADVDDPIAYVVGMAAGLGVQVIVVFDLGHVDCQPALICDEGFDLETVCPQGTWARSAKHQPGVEMGAA
ncbi:hypothetical protein OG874_22300 [Nocardia sp. NBC_00565]|uniref:hypothetical protein n=1 Tax=Nocardia sp. NBC_00565 TaxID=2975993 RepID=UPI002E81B8BB|nr:hypothetical protein [Nocardia sp. NBC_00565]WUC07650.1 hypothetical protein OG874_22300 [Nocardia sp. NBC_00565]